VCIEPATDGGSSPTKIRTEFLVGIATVGVEFTSHLTFTIADGATDFAAGDAFHYVALNDARRGGRLNLCHLTIGCFR
jgi:hypothetical protein